MDLRLGTEISLRKNKAGELEGHKGYILKIITTADKKYIATCSTDLKFQRKKTRNYF